MTTFFYSHSFFLLSKKNRNFCKQNSKNFQKDNKLYLIFN
nr:MAG TPA: hypothetical protein [Caudoviricetes sp.]